MANLQEKISRTAAKGRGHGTDDAELMKRVAALASSPEAIEVVALGEHMRIDSRSGFSIAGLGGWVTDLNLKKAEAGLRRFAEAGVLSVNSRGSYRITDEGRAAIAHCLPKDEYMGDLFFVGECFKDFKYWMMRKQLKSFRAQVAGFFRDAAENRESSSAPAADCPSLNRARLPRLRD